MADTMTPGAMSAVKDKNYNLISAVRESLQNVWQMDNYIRDAQREGDTELVEWFQKIQYNNHKAADQGKQLLLRRLESEGS